MAEESLSSCRCLKQILTFGFVPLGARPIVQGTSKMSEYVSVSLSPLGRHGSLMTDELVLLI